MKQKKIINHFKGWTSFIVFIVVLLIIRTFIIEPFRVPSGSMRPTLEVGDFIFTTKYPYGYSQYSFPFSLVKFQGRTSKNITLKRGQIVVFAPPKQSSIRFVKRAIGLPGDTVQMINGRLYINGTIVPRTLIAPYNYKDYQNHEFKPNTPTYIEHLPNGIDHRIIEVDGDNGYMDNTAPYTVPEGYFFAMGDNRDRSEDSRFSAVGYIPLSNLLGPVVYIWLSVDYNSAHWWYFWNWTFRYHHTGSPYTLNQ